jgi:hypothetical protein
MTNQAMVGRGIAAVGVVCGLIAIWTNLVAAGVQGRTYWAFDGTLAGLLLILAGVSGLLVLAASATNRRDLDVALAGVGATLFGLYLWYPALFATDQWKVLGTGAWLGVCTVLIVVGALVAIRPSMAAVTSRPEPIGTLVALVGLVLVLVGIWTKATSSAGTYWNVPGNGHSLGAAMLVFVVLSAVAIAAAHVLAVGKDAALVLAGVTLGLTLLLPVAAAFDHLGDLGVGGWLAVIGGLALLVGVVLMRRMAPATAPAATPAVATSPPAA